MAVAFAQPHMTPAAALPQADVPVVVTGLGMLACNGPSW